MAQPDMPTAWQNLLEGLALLAKHQCNETSPLHCEPGELMVMSDPDSFTPDEIQRLKELGFQPNWGQSTFYSFIYGSA